MYFNIEECAIRQHRTGELVVRGAQQHIRRARTVRGLRVNIEVTSAIRREDNASSVRTPKRPQVRGCPECQTAASSALQIMDPKIETFPDNGTGSIRRKDRFSVDGLVLARTFRVSIAVDPDQ